MDKTAYVLPSIPESQQKGKQSEISLIFSNRQLKMLCRSFQLTEENGVSWEIFFLRIKSKVPHKDM